MGFRFRRSIRILPGLRINLSKKGISSITIGRRGASLNINRRGEKRATVGIPGTGLSWQTQLDRPVGRKMTECPFCGHRMRKRWDRCPQCGASLLAPQEESHAPSTPASASSPAANAPEEPPLIGESGEPPASALFTGTGCGCLGLLLIAAFGVWLW